MLLNYSVRWWDLKVCTLPGPSPPVVPWVHFSAVVIRPAEVERHNNREGHQNRFKLLLIIMDFLWGNN